jgi:hypothetical protein
MKMKKRGRVSHRCSSVEVAFSEPARRNPLHVKLNFTPQGVPKCNLGTREALPGLLVLGL